MPLAPGKALLTGAVDIHVDGLLVTHWCCSCVDDQAGDTVIDLAEVRRAGVSPEG